MGHPAFFLLTAVVWDTKGAGLCLITGPRDRLLTLMKFLNPVLLAVIALSAIYAQAQRVDDSTANDQLKPPSTLNRNLYPADADAKADISAALHQAQAENKNVLLDFGATWCFDCHVLDNALQRADLKSILDVLIRSLSMIKFVQEELESCFSTLRYGVGCLHWNAAPPRIRRHF
jgi:thiol:disulfide interchange protein